MLTPEQLDHLYMRAGLGKFHLKDYAMECEYDRCIYGFARAIEAEVRKDDGALIRQMLEALTAPVDGEALHALHMSAIAAARARLFDSGLSTLTERGAKAWAGVDTQKLREGKAP